MSFLQKICIILIHEIYYTYARLVLKKLYPNKRIEKNFDLLTLPRVLGSSTPVIVEIGGHDGSTTKQFLNLFPESNIYVFEPGRTAIKKI